MGYFELKKSMKAGNSTLLTGLGGISGSSASKVSQEYYFVLKANNGEVIATSEMYSSKQAAQNGIESVRSNGSTSDIRDLT